MEDNVSRCYISKQLLRHIWEVATQVSNAAERGSHDEIPMEEQQIGQRHECTHTEVSDQQSQTINRVTNTAKPATECKFYFSCFF